MLRKQNGSQNAIPTFQKETKESNKEETTPSYKKTTKDSTCTQKEITQEVSFPQETTRQEITRQQATEQEQENLSNPEVAGEEVSQEKTAASNAEETSVTQDWIPAAVLSVRHFWKERFRQLYHKSVKNCVHAMMVYGKSKNFGAAKTDFQDRLPRQSHHTERHRKVPPDRKSICGGCLHNRP